MVLESTQSLTETITKNLPGGKGGRARKAQKFTVIYEPIIWKVWEPPRPLTGIALPFLFTLQIAIHILATQIHTEAVSVGILSEIL
jgi:ABC-type cobalt transport system substrate-binding protein